MFPVDSVVTAGRICANAEQTVNYATIHSFVRRARGGGGGGGVAKNAWGQVLKSI
jgi:hypothetical protein